MAQQDQLGPFSEYLTKPAAAAMAPMPVPPVTGMEGTGAAIGNIAMNFINGLRQGRMQKYAMQEAEREKQFNAYQHAIKTVAASDLPDQQKQMLHAKLSLPLIQSIAGDKNATSKQTGNPLTDVVKNVATGIIGGNVPKKGQPLSMEPVVEALQMASDPSLSKTRLVSGYESRLMDRAAKILKENPNADSSAIFKDPEIIAIRKEANQLVGPYESPYIKQLLSEFKRESPEDQMRRRVFEQMFPRVTGVSPGQQTQQAPPKEGVQKPSPVTGEPPMTETMAGPTSPELADTEERVPLGAIKISPEDLSNASAAATLLKSPNLFSQGSTTEEFEDLDGNRVVGKSLSARIGNRFVRGIYDESKGILYQNFKKRLRPGEFTKQEMNDAYTDVRQQIDAALSGIEGSDSVKASMLAQANSALKTGDITKLRTIPEQVTRYAIDVDKDKAAEARQMKQLSAADSRMRAHFEQQENLYNRRAVGSAKSLWLRNPIVAAYNTVSAQVSGIENATKIKQYLASGGKMPMSAEELTLMDKDLARLASKATDPTTGVKTTEEEGYNKLSSFIEELKKQGSYLTGGSKLGNYESRKQLYSLVKNIENSLGKKSEELKPQYMNAAIGAPQEMLNQAFDIRTSGAGKPQYRPAPTGTSRSVLMRLPDNTLVNIPEANVKEAEKRGAVRAQ